MLRELYVNYVGHKIYKTILTSFHFGCNISIIDVKYKSF